MEDARPQDQRQNPSIHEPVEDTKPPTDSNEVADERAQVEEPETSD